MEIEKISSTTRYTYLPIEKEMKYLSRTILHFRLKISSGITYFYLELSLAKNPLVLCSSVSGSGILMLVLAENLFLSGILSCTLDNT